MFARFRRPKLKFSVAAAGDEEVGGRLLNERAAVYRLEHELLVLLLLLLFILFLLVGEFWPRVGLEGANGFSMAEEIVRILFVQFVPKKLDGAF